MRLHDWEMRLGEYLRSAAADPHVYGGRDCLLFCGEWVEAVTGVDHGSAHRGKYRTEAGAVRYLKRLGFESPEQLLDTMLEQAPPAFAQRGDLVLTPSNSPGGWNIPGGCVGADALCLSENGFVREPRHRWLKAWRVGHIVAAPPEPTGRG